MSDGAHLGVGASRALDTILGGKDAPTEDEGRSPAQMRAYLEGAPDAPTGLAGGEGYEESARIAGKRVLAFLDAHPDFRHLSTDDPHVWGTKPDGSVDYDDYRITALGMWSAMELAGVAWGDLGLSGFQAGWATNAAKYAVGAPPSPNPAILNLNVPT